jgi:plasmid maintenance system antidote protein VapI
MSERRRINPQTMAKDLVYIKSKINEILTDENNPVSANDIRILKKDIENLFERWLRIENKIDNLQEVERRNNRNINFLLFCIPLLLGVDIFLRFF